VVKHDQSPSRQARIAERIPVVVQGCEWPGGRVAACLAAASAISLPTMPAWPGVQPTWTSVDWEWSSAVASTTSRTRRTDEVTDGRDIVQRAA
jgi:hypothetical protein